MIIQLSEQCESLTGTLNKKYGYYIQVRNTKSGDKRFCSARSRGKVPADGHLKFIFTCAKLTESRLHMVDIRLTADELADALREASKFVAARKVTDNFVNYTKRTYNAQDILNLKTTFGL